MNNILCFLPNPIKENYFIDKCVRIPKFTILTQTMYSLT